MLLLSAAVAASFVCASPRADDAATLRCADHGPVLHLKGVMAPPSAKACKPGEDCTLDPGIAARRRLQALVDSSDVVCVGSGQGGARCYAGGIDLSCAMQQGGPGKKKAAVNGCPAASGGPLSLKKGARAFMQLPQLWRWVPLFLMTMNIITYLAFLSDLERSRTGLHRIARPHLLGLVLFGGGIGAAAGHQKFPDVPAERSFAVQMYAIIGLQIGAITGLMLLYYVPLPL